MNGTQKAGCAIVAGWVVLSILPTVAVVWIVLHFALKFW